MAVTAKLTASLPKLAVLPDMRDRVEKAADKAEVGMADIVRDCIALALPRIELALGLVDLEDLDDDDLGALGLTRLPTEPEEPPVPPKDAPWSPSTGWGPDRGRPAPPVGSPGLNDGWTNP